MSIFQETEEEVNEEKEVGKYEEKVEATGYVYLLIYNTIIV